MERFILKSDHRRPISTLLMTKIMSKINFVAVCKIVREDTGNWGIS